MIVRHVLMTLRWCIAANDSRIREEAWCSRTSQRVVAAGGTGELIAMPVNRQKKTGDNGMDGEWRGSSLAAPGNGFRRARERSHVDRGIARMKATAGKLHAGFEKLMA